MPPPHHSRVLLAGIQLVHAPPISDVRCTGAVMLDLQLRRSEMTSDEFVTVY